MATATEAPVREDEDTQDGDEEAQQKGELFDKSRYETEELALPKIDGEGVDKIAAKFGGTVWLERGNEHDVALIREPKFGSTVTLLVEATVSPPIAGYTTSKEGDLDALFSGRRFTVTSVRRAAGAEL